MGTTFTLQLVCLPEARSQGGASGHKQGMGWGMEADKPKTCGCLPVGAPGCSGQIVGAFLGIGGRFQAQRSGRRP